MSEFLSRLSGNDAGLFLFLACCLVLGIASIIGVVWYKLRKAEIDASLKQDMLNRGMSAEEIKTILEAADKK